MLKTRKFPSPNSDLSFESQTGMSNSLRDMPSWVLQKHLKLTVFQTELLGPPCPYQEMVSSVTQIKTSEVLLDSFLPSYSPPFPQHHNDSFCLLRCPRVSLVCRLSCCNGSKNWTFLIIDLSMWPRADYARVIQVLYLTPLSLSRVVVQDYSLQ